MLATPAVLSPPAPPADQSPVRRRRQRRREQSGAGNAFEDSRGGKSRGAGGELQQVEWMLREFKSAPCSLESPTSSHDHRCCPFYHSGRDRRRAVLLEGGGGLNYQGEPCPQQFDDSRTCARGDSCALCHSTAELLYHPDFFRKRLCHQARRCPRGRFCAFAHTRQELLVPHFGEAEEAEPTEEFIAYRFKTQWCPVGGPHDWENCVYAHTYRDWRRVPILGYSSHPCPRWTNSVASGSPELTYSERCPYGFACPLAHGAKEQLYHPQFYKTSPCSDGNCRRGPLCAFTHGDHDARQLRVEDVAPRASRRPIPQAEELLRQYQPTFSEPPMYHALEDAPRGGSGASGGKSRNRRKGGGNGGGAGAGAGAGNGNGNGNNGNHAPADAGARAPRVVSTGDASRTELLCERPQLPLSLLAGGEPRAPAQAVFAPYPACQFMGYQWVSVAESPSPQPVPSAVSYQGVGEPRVLSYMNAPMVWNPGHLPPAPAPLPAPLPGPGASQCFLTVPQPQSAPAPAPAPGPSPADSPVRVQRQAPEEYATDAAERSPAASRSPMDLKVPTLPLLRGLRGAGLTVEIPDFNANPPDFTAWQQSLAEAAEFPMKPANLSAWKKKYCAKDGWRTPSSFGSPPLSGAPTAASSPRFAEAASSTHTGDCSEHTSMWDEAGRESLI